MHSLVYTFLSAAFYIFVFVFVFVFAFCFPCCGIFSFLVSPRLVAYCFGFVFSFHDCVIALYLWFVGSGRATNGVWTVWVIQCHSQRHLGISVPPVWRHVTAPALQCWLLCHNFSCGSLIFCGCCFCACNTTTTYSSATASWLLCAQT